MHNSVAIIFVILASLAICHSVPVDIDVIHPSYYSDIEGPITHIRIRRSPAIFGFSAGGSERQQFLRGDINHNIWKSSDGTASIDGHAYYQRDFGGAGPKQHYGGDIRISKKF